MAVQSSLKNMVMCLGTITLVCALLLSAVFVITEEPIAEAAKAKSDAAIASVCPEGVENIIVLYDKDDVPYNCALSADGDTLCYIINGKATGFGGPITLMVGIFPDGTICKTSVLGHSETPGLGAKCTDESFSSQFEGFDTAAKTLAVTVDGGDVDAITAATITSRAYCKALEDAMSKFRTIRPAKTTMSLLNNVQCAIESLFVADSTIDIDSLVAEVMEKRDSVIEVGGQSNE